MAGLTGEETWRQARLFHSIAAQGTPWEGNPVPLPLPLPPTEDSVP